MFRYPSYPELMILHCMHILKKKHIYPINMYNYYTFVKIKNTFLNNELLSVRHRILFLLVVSRVLPVVVAIKCYLH